MTTTPGDASLTSLCGGMLTSAWDGVCNGVATAAWQVVQSAFLNPRTAEAPAKPVSKTPLDVTGQSIIACLAGKAQGEDGLAQTVASDGKQVASSSNPGSNDQMMALMLELQQQQLKQQAHFQEQLLQIQTAAKPASTSPTSSHTEDSSGADPGTEESARPERLRSRLPIAKGRAKASAKGKAKSKAKAKVAPAKRKRSDE